MEKILLVEPNYKNKYPPIGLMKISTYFKKKGDFVEFHKGLMPKLEVLNFNKVFITTLFTFDFDICVQTINYYMEIVGSEHVYVGGIAASILPERFKEAIPQINILTGQLISSNILGYDDNINIDILELDYDILWDISYEYPAADSYFIYTSRGCPRKCAFCAVKTLEPQFYDCDNLIQQVKNVDLHFGIKKNLLIMDNNILYSDRFDKTIDELVYLGFGKYNNKIKKCNYMKYYLKSLKRRIENGQKVSCLLKRIRRELISIKYSRISNKDKERLQCICAKPEELSESELLLCLKKNDQYLIEFFERYHFHMITRHVDFNQGLDARLFSDKKAKKISEVAIKPCRIAFDNISTREDYFTAMENAVKYGIKNFSNYLLYNYDENPKSLWLRLKLNIDFCKKYKKDGISLFSFPMRYASIERTDRSYIGVEWHRKYLRAMNVILNVTSGVVAKEEDFFLRAYGNTEEEFIEILTMPDDFIRFRDFFEEKGFTQLWKKYYSILNKEQKDILIDILDRMTDEPDIMLLHYDVLIDKILQFYLMKKKKIEKNELYYENQLKKLQL